MECNLNNNYSSVSFGAIKTVSGGKDLLNKALKATEKLEFNKLVEAQKSNPVDVYLAQRTGKRLAGWTVFENKNTKEYHRKDYTQRVLFDSPMDFVKRLCKKADELKTKHFDNTPDVELNI